jgi:hypothetical protein
LKKTIPYKLAPAVSKHPRIVAALSVCRKLHDRGWVAYWVGGAVRDLLLNTTQVPCDIDIATDAPYKEICRILPDTRAIGKAFGVGLVSTGEHSFEVATFRKESDYADRRHPSQVGPGTIEEDSERRDFTVNALYFDPIAGVIVDFHEGISDLKNKIIRCVGEARIRLHEDPLRILRLFRFTANFGFNIDPETARAAEALGGELVFVSKERVLLEISKLKTSSVPVFANLFKTVQRHLVTPHPTSTVQTSFPWSSCEIPEGAAATSPGTVFALVCAANESSVQSVWPQTFQSWPFSLEEKAQLDFFQRIQLDDFTFSTSTTPTDWKAFLESLRWLQRQSRINAEAAVWLLNWPKQIGSKSTAFSSEFRSALQKEISAKEEMRLQPVALIIESWIRDEAQPIREKAHKKLEGQKAKSALGWARLMIDSNILLKKIGCFPESGPEYLLSDPDKTIDEICKTAIQWSEPLRSKE